MFRASKPARAVSSFAMFLIDSTGAAKYKGLGFFERAEKLTREFKRLGAQGRRRLYVRGRKIPTPVPRALRPRAPRKLSVYNKFVRSNITKVKGSGNDRIRAVAKQWNATKK